MSKGLVGRARWRDAMRVTSGGLLATSLALLAAVLIADVNVVETAQRNVSRYHAEVLDDRVVRVDTVPAHNGDIVRVWPQWDLPGQAFATHEAWDGRPWTHARLQAAVRLNYDLYQSYLLWLAQKGFVAQEPGGDRMLVRITREGVAARAQLCGWIARVLGASILDRRRDGAAP